jgi:WXG100 family type VII secretion target
MGTEPAGADAYSIDLDELDDVIGDLEQAERALELLTNDLEGQIRKLHEQWEGLSATAQAEAHQEWEQGMTDMRAALKAMRSAARVAHGNYSLAISTNLGMWEGLA